MTFFIAHHELGVSYLNMGYAVNPVFSYATTVNSLK